MKRKLFKHVIAILGIAVLAFLSIGSAASTPKEVIIDTDPAPAAPAAPNPNTGILTSTTKSDGTFHQLPNPSERPFDVLGLIFATSVTEIDERGQVLASQESIGTMLLRQAQQLGGNDILNLRVDENTTTIAQESTGGRIVHVRRIIYTGSAIAVRYR